MRERKLTIFGLRREDEARIEDFILLVLLECRREVDWPRRGGKKRGHIYIEKQPKTGGKKGDKDDLSEKRSGKLRATSSE